MGDSRLQGYRDEIARLRAENEQLRQSAETFGRLAERLMVALRTARLEQEPLSPSNPQPDGPLGRATQSVFRLRQ